MTTSTIRKITFRVKNDEACGLLPYMILQGESGIEENLIANYPFFWGWTEDEAEVVNEQFTYPEDEPLDWVGKFEEDGKLLYIYPYGIVAIVEGGKTKWTRCD